MHKLLATEWTPKDWTRKQGCPKTRWRDDLLWSRLAKLVMQCFQVVYRWISHKCLVLGFTVLFKVTFGNFWWKVSAVNICMPGTSPWFSVTYYILAYHRKCKGFLAFWWAVFTKAWHKIRELLPLEMFHGYYMYRNFWWLQLEVTG